MRKTIIFRDSDPSKNILKIKIDVAEGESDLDCISRAVRRAWGRDASWSCASIDHGSPVGDITIQTCSVYTVEIKNIYPKTRNKLTALHVRRTV